VAPQEAEDADVVTLTGFPLGTAQPLKTARMDPVTDKVPGPLALTNGVLTTTTIASGVSRRPGEKNNLLTTRKYTIIQNTMIKSVLTAIHTGRTALAAKGANQQK
jgi:hypothetical protein